MKRWDGVADGTRTHDDQNHNLGLYQLSYSHRRVYQYSARWRDGQGAEALRATRLTTSGTTSALNRFFSAAR